MPRWPLHCSLVGLFLEVVARMYVTKVPSMPFGATPAPKAGTMERRLGVANVEQLFR